MLSFFDWIRFQALQQVTRYQGIMEQSVAIQADRFLPSFPSSWGSVVLTRRLVAEKPDAEDGGSTT